MRSSDDKIAPLEIRMLLDLYTHPEIHPNGSDEEDLILTGFSGLGLCAYTAHGCCITTKGEAYVEGILEAVRRVPLPVWTVPQGEP